MPNLFTSVLLLVALLSGCASQHPKIDQSWRASADLNSFEGFGKALENSITAGDSSLFVDHLDSHQFAWRSLSSLGLTSSKDDTINTYASLMDEAVKQRFNETFTSVESARFVRLMPEDQSSDETVALIRMDPKEGGINYWKVYLKRRQGHIAIIDWFSYSLGDLASRSLGRFILYAGVAALRPDMNGSPEIMAYLSAAQSNDPEKILATYKQLPVNMQSNSLLMQQQVLAAQKISDEVYRAVLSRLAPTYEKNDDYALLLVDYYIYNNEHEQAHRAIDRAAATIGQDAGLDSLHAGIAVQTGDYKRAIAYARDGINREPAYEDNYWTLLDALVYSNNYTEAVLVLNILEEGFDYRFDAHQLATLEGYQDFANSDVFRSWQTAALN
jgi:tetratricopeptide (TPR) repeat protein